MSFIRKLKLIVCATLILSGISFKICGCDCGQAALFLVIKDAGGQDVFNPGTAGYYAKDQVSLIAEGATGQVPVKFYLMAADERLGNYHLLIGTIAASVYFNLVIYLKLENQNQYAFTLHLPGLFYVIQNILSFYQRNSCHFYRAVV